MRPRFVLAAGLFGLACVVGAAAASTSPALPALPEVVERSDWLTIETATDARAIADAIDAYGVQQARIGRNSDVLPPDFELAEGELRGRWILETTEDGVSRKAALHLRFADAPPYRVRARLHCSRQAPAQCETLRARLVSLEAPHPYSNPALAQAWQQIVLREACEVSGPVAVNPPVYPREEERRGIVGIVTLMILHNRCGKVRNAYVFKSSGNRNLDRSAVKTAMRWVVKPFEAGKGGLLRTDIEFKLDDATAPSLANPPPTPPAATN